MVLFLDDDPSRAALAYQRMSEKDKDNIALFLKDPSGELHIISNIDKDTETFAKGWKLVYLGKPFDVEKI